MRQQTKTPLLSVIIPVYNAQDYIEQCLNSVRDENIPEVEIICVDDGSTDASVEILEAFAGQDARIRVIRQSNRSAGAARNNGLSHAKGKYIHFLDADDQLCPGTYRRIIGLLEKTEADVCMFQYLLHDCSTGREIKCPCLLNRGDEVTQLRREPAFFLYNMVAPWNKLYRRAWVEEHALRFDEIVCGNDRGFYFRMLAAGGQIALCQHYGVSYRVKNAASLTGSNRWRHFDSLFFAWDTSVEAMAEEGPEIRAMTLDCAVRDILAVFRQTPPDKQNQVLGQLQQRFQQSDLSAIEALPLPCVWRQDVQLLREGKNPCEASRRTGDWVRQQVAACRIWGIRGRLIKALARK